MVKGCGSLQAASNQRFQLGDRRSLANQSYWMSGSKFYAHLYVVR
jgi:hypothetical protein